MNVLAICRGFIPSVILCGHSQLEYLKNKNKLDYRFKLSNQVSIDDLLWLDILIVIRGDSSFELSLCKWCKKYNKKIIYVLDDNILEIANDLATSDFYSNKYVHNTIVNIMKISDGFVSPSKKLLEKFGSTFDNKFQIIEPSLSPIKEKEKSIDDKIHIGFAGSIDRGKDVDTILYNALKKIKEKYKDKVIIELFGVKTQIAEELNIVQHSFLDSYEKYQNQMKEYNWDIGLAPLPDSEFYTFKHYNKLIEYSSYGIAGIYSNVFPYKYAVINNLNGLLVENTTDDWFNAISTLIENINLRKQIQNECINEANSIFSLEKASNELLLFLNNFELTSKNPSNKFILFIKRKYWRFKNKFFIIFSLGFKSPIVIIKKAINKLKK